jgi:hypothetical protein
MYRVLATLSFLAISGAAMAGGPFPSTLSPEERERHEFLDAQRGIRSGVEAIRRQEMTRAPRQQEGRAVLSNDATNYPPAAPAIGGNF